MILSLNDSDKILGRSGDGEGLGRGMRMHQESEIRDQLSGSTADAGEASEDPIAAHPAFRTNGEQIWDSSLPFAEWCNCAFLKFFFNLQWGFAA